MGAYSFSSLIWLVYILHATPFKEKRQKIIELLNETCFLICTYFVYTFSEYVENAEKRKTGWVFIGLIAFMIVSNYAANIQELISQKIRERK